MTHGRMRWRTPRSAAVVALVGAVMVLALGSVESESPVADAVVVAADGDLDLQSSKDGVPILSASGLGPGDTASGQVTVTNAGTGSGQFSLKRENLSDSPGVGGSALSERLQLVVNDLTAPGSPTTVYSGALGTMPEKALGTLGPGQARTYKFEASFPEGGSADNAYAGAAANVGYKWTVSSSSSEPPVDPPGGGPDGNGGSGSGNTGEPSDGGTLPSSTQSLRIAVKLARKQRVKRKRLLVKVRCTEACKLSARGRIAAKRVKKPLGKTTLARKSGRAGRWVKIKLKLSNKTLAKIARAKAQRRKVTVKITVNALTAAGSKAKAAKSGRIR